VPPTGILPDPDVSVWYARCPQVLRQETVVPKVGKKHFPYTAAGKKAAKSYAKKTAKKATTKKKKKRY
jgi:hypothetical protein